MIDLSILMTAFKHSNDCLPSERLAVIQQFLLKHKLGLHGFQSYSRCNVLFSRWQLDNLSQKNEELVSNELRAIVSTEDSDWQLSGLHEQSNLGLFAASNSNLLKELIEFYSAAVSPKAVARLNFVMTFSEDLARQATKFGIPCYVIDQALPALEQQSRCREVLQRYRTDVLCFDGDYPTLSANLLKESKALSLRVIPASVPHAGRFNKEAPTGAGQLLVSSCVLEEIDIKASTILAQSAHTVSAVDAGLLQEVAHMIETECMMDAIDAIVQCRVMRSNHGVFVFD